VSGYHQLTPAWAIVGNIGWQEWSEFGKQEINLQSSTSRSFTQDLNYNDTWHFALGAQYRFAPEWLWSFGAAYDTSPVDDDEDRTPDLALDRQIRLATGLQYDWNRDVTIGAAYEYIDLGDGGVNRNDGPLKGPLKGDYNPYAIHVFALNMIWRF
jgi:long-chain fatty acid transport protein